MNKTFLQRLQKVKIKDIFSIFLFLIAIIPAVFVKLLKKPFWVICDCENEAQDNGFAFFKYIINNQQQDCYFAINFNCSDFKKIENIDTNKFIKFGSLKHWIYYLACEYNLSSQKNGKPNAAICYLLEIYGPLKHKTIFLQHGIICNDLPYVHYKNSKFALFVTSTQKEFEYVSNNFNYPEDFVQKLGLARFDNLKDISKEVNDKFILVMPTWRQWIANGDYLTKNVEDISDFKGTEYFKAWSEFLNSSELNNYLEKHNKFVIFYLHRKMQPFLDFFKISNDRIIIASDINYNIQELLNSSSLLITDYSSVSMDFAYLKKPLIYYQFDYEMFRKHHLEEGYFSYENDGFGKVVYTQDELLLDLEGYLMSNFKLNETYEKRIENFFDLRDNNNCQRIYDAIKNKK